MADRMKPREDRSDPDLVDVDYDAPPPASPVEKVSVASPRTGAPPRPKSEPVPKSTDEVRVVLEPVESHPYDLSYTSLLIPRFPAHLLMGDLADCLHGWMKQICISFGWRLEFISIRPEYLQWALRVPPVTPPAYFMRIFRQQTSLQIMSEFPRIKRQNLSDDFWAPGYLVIFGARPQPPELIQEFIRLTRQQQGITSRR
jgi:REP element-mobilizing transposase RayT